MNEVDQTLLDLALSGLGDAEFFDAAKAFYDDKKPKSPDPVELEDVSKLRAKLLGLYALGVDATLD